MRRRRLRFSPQVDRPKRSPAPVYVQFARAILRISKPATRDQTKTSTDASDAAPSAKCTVRIAQTSSYARAPVSVSRSSARNADGRSDGSICKVSYPHGDFWGGDFADATPEFIARWEALPSPREKMLIDHLIHVRIGNSAKSVARAARGDVLKIVEN